MTARIISLGRRERPEDAAADLASMIAEHPIRGVLVVYWGPVTATGSCTEHCHAFGDVQESDVALLAARLLANVGRSEDDEGAPGGA